MEITLGASAEQMTQVVGGELKIGDEVVLNPPSTLFTPGSGGAMPAGLFGMGGNR